MKKKILIINPHLEHRATLNKGAQAVIETSILMLKQMVTDAEIVTNIQFWDDNIPKALGCITINNKRFSHKDFSLITSLSLNLDITRAMLWRFFRRYLKSDIGFLVGSKKLREYASADLVIHLGMDLYSDDLGFLSVREHSKDILLCLILGRPVVMWAESIGPFNSRVTRWLARFILNRTLLITLRENTSRQHLVETHITKPAVCITADPAFILEPAPATLVAEILNTLNVAENERLVAFTLREPLQVKVRKQAKGIAMAKKMYLLAKYILPESFFNTLVRTITRTPLKNLPNQEYAGYIKDNTQIIDFITEQLDSSIILISHTEQATHLDDFAQVMESIRQAAINPDRVKVLKSGYTASEIKGVIGKCNMHIGGKMHSNIASLSQCVPTLGLSYSHKFQGIMGMLGQEKYVCTSTTPEEIIGKIKEVWSAKVQIKDTLQSRMPEIRELALLNAKMANDLLQDKTSQ